MYRPEKTEALGKNKDRVQPPASVHAAAHHDVRSTADSQLLYTAPRHALRGGFRPERPFGAVGRNNYATAHHCQLIEPHVHALTALRSEAGGRSPSHRVLEHLARGLAPLGLRPQLLRKQPEGACRELEWQARAQEAMQACDVWATQHGLADAAFPLGGSRGEPG